MAQVQETLDLPEGVTGEVREAVVVLRGPKGETSKELRDAHVSVKVEGNKVTITAPNSKKRARTTLRTFLAHVKNLITGVTEGYTYKLKICSGHFPMNVAVSGSEFVVKNFIGEKTPRKFTIHPDAKIQVNGEEVVVESVNKEVAGQTAASIESLAKRTGFDSRIFQSGIFITNKAGKSLVD